jgi:5'-nucleotidase
MTQSVTKSLLLTNDDGVDAPGLSALVAACEGLGNLRVIAPFGPYSSCSHAVTTHKPLVVHRREDGRIAVEGAPADCVRLAIDQLAPGFTRVISGINAGGNLGNDTFHSGTVAAVREAVMHGRSGIAVSQYMARGRDVDWERSARWASRVIRSLLERPWEPGTFWNVNLPHPGPDAPEPEVVECLLDPSPLPLSYRWESDGRVAHYCGEYSSRARVPSSDVDVCFGGRIAVTLMRLS